MYSEIYKDSLKRAKQKIWILSDLQQSNPEYAKECMNTGIEDYLSLNNQCDMIWYLGDSVEGKIKHHLDDMVQMQENAFGSLNIPLCYVMGNHDFDYALNVQSKGEKPYIPFYEMVRSHNGWYTSDNIEDMYFKVPVGNFNVYFLNDHISLSNEWVSTQGWIAGDTSKYPYSDEDYTKLSNLISNDSKKVIIASHYGFYGANRQSNNLSRLLPLGENVKIHFYGHAHVGDFKWAEKDSWRRISWIDWHDIPQIEVSSFEHIRGKKCRSVFLHIYEDDSMGIFFRNHNDHVFTEAYFPSKVSNFDARNITADMLRPGENPPKPSWM